MNYKYRFTVFTPCYNSEKFIHRVIESLESQTFKNFEWLVINDASTDNTLKILLDYENIAQFPMRIINNQTNKMLYYNFNLAFQEAKGEFMVFAGHDDRFHVETLEVFNNVWNKYGNDNIAGIWCLCEDQNGNQIGRNFPEKITISNYFDMFVKYIYKQERFGCTRTDILKKYKFDILNERIGEGFLWERIGLNYKTIYLNKVLRTYYIETENKNALTKQSREKIALHTYYSYLDWVNYYLRRIKQNYVFKLRYHFALAFYAILSQRKANNVIKSINKIYSKVLVSILYPFALLTSILLKLKQKFNQKLH